MRPRSLFLFLLLVCSASEAQITTVPSPQAGQPFELHIDSTRPDCEDRSRPRLLIAGKRVFLTFDANSFCIIEPSPVPWNVSIPMPGLAAGTYHVQVRLAGNYGVHVAFESDFTVAGAPAGIEISPAFDTAAGNRVVTIRGSFPGSTPAVLFGQTPAETVERISDSELQAVVPLQTHVRFVDVTVRGDGYTYVLPSGFLYMDISEFEAVLLPVYTRRPLPGAFGSLWQTDLRILNASDGGDLVTPIPGIDVLYANGDVPPQRVSSPVMTLPRSDVDSPPTAMLFLRREFSRLLRFQLRVRDVSRQALSWGTDVPVVREGQYSSYFHLVDVPVRPGFRSQLRIYSPGYAGCCNAMVQFRSPSGTPITHRAIQMLRPNGAMGGLVPPPYLREGSRELPLQPAYAELDLGSIQELEGHDTVWIVVSTSTQSWGMVSVTNEITQEVTLVVPR